MQETGTSVRTIRVSSTFITRGCGRRPHELTEIIMRRVLAITASCFALAACSSFSLPSFEMPSFGSGPTATTLEFESEPPGADVKTSTGQTCRTPCALSVAANELTATFSLNGYQSQTVPVRMASASDNVDTISGEVPPPRMTPNPVYAELMLAVPVRRPPPPPPAVKPAPKKKLKPVAKPKPSADPMSSPPASAPPSPWPAPITTPR
jgi:hypothetical protein